MSNFLCFSMHCIKKSRLLSFACRVSLFFFIFKNFFVVNFFWLNFTVFFFLLNFLLIFLFLIFFFFFFFFYTKKVVLSDYFISFRLEFFFFFPGVCVRGDTDVYIIPNHQGCYVVEILEFIKLRMVSSLIMCIIWFSNYRKACWRKKNCIPLNCWEMLTFLLAQKSFMSIPTFPYF